MTTKMGRPIERDRKKIAKELLEWAKLSDSINLCKFCCTRDPPLAPSKLCHYAKEDENFRQTYETAKSYLGARREYLLTNNQLHVKAYDINSSTYDYFLKEERREDAKYNSDLKVKENSQLVSPYQNELDREDRETRLQAKVAMLEAKLKEKESLHGNERQASD